MAKHIDIGKEGEELAVDYFAAKGYEILHKNWRKGHWELDIIAVKAGIVHFIEVKTKSSNYMGYPEDEVTKEKFRYLTSAAEEFLFQYPNWNRIQFDILAITLKPEMNFFLIEDFFL